LPETIAVLIGVLVLLGGCTAAASLKNVTSTPSAPSAAAYHGQIRQSRYQLGIDLDFYWYKGMNVPRVVAVDAAYAKSLGANAVSIAFPVYAYGSKAAPGPATPKPAIVGQAVRAARSQGLAVYLRPLLDEKNLPTSRVPWRPTDLAEWFRSYQAFLLPYARVAQAGGVSGLYVGTELSAFARSRYWTALDIAVGNVYHGQLYYSANWSDADQHKLAGSGGSPVTVTVDAYHPMPVPVAKISAAWTTWVRRLPRGTVLSEVGIAARADAQYRPWMWKPSDAPLDPQVQSAWFAAACQAVRVAQLGGIYFWSINVGQSLDTPPTSRTANSFAFSPGATAIKACFAELEAA
jgi:hypothetical protein